MKAFIPPPEGADREQIGSVARPRILVVEDEGIVALDLQTRLEKLGYQVVGVVASGEEAIARSAALRPDLVLMDITLTGEMDGVEAAEHLRVHHRVPVVYLTASSSATTLERAKTTEPFGYLLKPFSEPELETTIEIALYKHQAGEALRESEERFRILVEHAPEAIVVFDVDQERFVEANENAEQLFGRKRDDLLRCGLLEVSPLLQPDGRLSGEVAGAIIQEALDGGAPVVEWTCRNATGRLVPGEMRLVRLPAADRRLLRASIIDIAERKRLERELISLERLRALESMAREMAHNFNNILSGVLGFAELIRRHGRDPHVTASADQVIAGVQRARDLVQDLRNAIPGERGDILQPVQVNQVVEEAVQEIRPHWQDGPSVANVSIEVVTDLEEVPPVEGTPEGLHAMLDNLLVNAVEAMPAGGMIALRTRALGPEVQLIVSDTGEGMDELTCTRVFEPFFTTKQDVGSGLGLFSVYGMVTRWGGTIDVESIPGQGTTFTLRFSAWKGAGSRSEKRAGLDEDEHVGAGLTRTPIPALN